MDGQWRVVFDADLTFGNEGGLQVQGFRLDIPGSDISDEALGELLVRHLGLLMVDSVRISGKSLPPGGFRFHAAPPLIEGMGTFPVRAYAVVGG